MMLQGRNLLLAQLKASSRDFVAGFLSISTLYSFYFYIYSCCIVYPSCTTYELRSFSSIDLPPCLGDNCDGCRRIHTDPK
jgi:hypothetical protein